jgi:hypothetical protein
MSMPGKIEFKDQIQHIPYRMRIVHERLKADPRMSPCNIQFEDLDVDSIGDAGYFPKVQHDTTRVFVEYRDLEVNVVGRLDDGLFAYHVNVYRAKKPFKNGMWATMPKLDEVIEFIAKIALEVINESQDRS